MLTAVLTALALAGCETVVEVDAPPHEPQLVAQSFFTADSLWAVRVTGTVPYGSSERPAYVDDATVEVYEEGQLLATPTLADSGTYLAQGRGPRPGRVYTLRATAPGFAATEGADRLPVDVPVTAFADTLLRPADGPPRRRLVEVELTLQDPPQEGNFYGLLVVQARWQEDQQGTLTPLPPSLFTFASSDPALGESELDFLNQEETLYRQAFFTDALFSGRARTIDFSIEYDEPRPESPVVIRRAFFVLALSVTEDFYRHWTTASEQAFANENPFAEPLRVHSNMSGGYGVFGGFRYRMLPLGISDLDVGGYTLADLCALIGGQLPLCIAPPVQ